MAKETKAAAARKSATAKPSAPKKPVKKSAEQPAAGAEKPAAQPKPAVPAEKPAKKPRLAEKGQTVTVHQNGNAYPALVVMVHEGNRVDVVIEPGTANARTLGTVKPAGPDVHSGETCWEA